ncbi:MAG: hypothetical protein AB7P17_13185 [Nitrospirales bacterium]
MTPNQRTNCSFPLSETQLITIEMGLEWLREENSVFSRKLYDRLLQDHAILAGPLSATGFSKFRTALLEAFHALVLAFRMGRNLPAALNEHWTIPIAEFTPPMQPERFDQVAETFLAVVAECVEDAWCPAVEIAWRTAIREIKHELVKDDDGKHHFT